MGEERRRPKLSEEAWALLGVLQRAAHGGPVMPSGFPEACAELRDQGLAVEVKPKQWRITDKGKEVWRARMHEQD